MPISRRLAALSVALVAGASALAPAAGAQTSTQATQLHDSLKLTPAQEPAWRAFLLGTQPDPQRRAQAEAAARLGPTLPTPRRLALARSQMQADMAAFDRTAQAVSAFYAQLTPDQQGVFDRVTAGGGQGQAPRAAPGGAPRPAGAAQGAPAPGR